MVEVQLQSFSPIIGHMIKIETGESFFQVTHKSLEYG